MTKYGPQKATDAAGKLAKFARGEGQDGARGGKLEEEGRRTAGGAPRQHTTDPEHADRREKVQESCSGKPVGERPQAERRCGAETELQCGGGAKMAAEGDLVTPEPTRAELLSAIQNMQLSLTSRLDYIQTELSFVKEDLKKIRERATETEQRVGELEDVVGPLQVAQTNFTKLTSDHSFKIDDLENRSRRSNLRFVGIPERSEGPTPETFLENWIKSTIPNLELSYTFSIERAHRVPGGPPRPGAAPRPILAKFLNYRDKVEILRKARVAPDLSVNGIKVSIYQDFSSEVQRLRATFLAVKEGLRNQQIPYSMLFPAKLRVQYNGKFQFFTTPAEAASWMEEQGIRIPSPPARQRR